MDSSDEDFDDFEECQPDLTDSNITNVLDESLDFQ